MNTLELITFEEGYRERAYHCTEGYPTIGIGTKLGPKGASLDNYTFRCNLRAAQAMLEDEVDQIIKALIRYDWYSNLNCSRKSIIISMCYQMGITGVLKFKNMIAALEREDWQEAHNQALDSRWAKQTPERAKRHADSLLNGSFDGVY